MTAHPTDTLRLAPVEPTSAMIQEGLATYHSDGRDDMETIRLIYAAMLAAAPASPLPEGAKKQIAGELDFIGGITANIALDLDELDAGFSKSQRTVKTERAMAKMRERAAVLIQCAKDAIAALPAAPTGAK